MNCTCHCRLKYARQFVALQAARCRQRCCILIASKAQWARQGRRLHSPTLPPSPPPPLPSDSQRLKLKRVTYKRKAKRKPRSASEACFNLLMGIYRTVTAPVTVPIFVAPLPAHSLKSSLGIWPTVQLRLRLRLQMRLICAQHCVVSRRIAVSLRVAPRRVIWIIKWHFI